MATTTQSFSSQPQAVSAQRKKKYREPGENLDPQVYRDPKETCITWDKRVHRGNTYSLYTQQAIKEALENVVAQSSPPPRRKRKPAEKSLFDMPLPELERVPVDLTQHLVAKEEVITLQTVEAQTDEFLPEPPAEHHQPQKTGMDVATQVEEGELFDFDYEAEPILDVLINKTLEQACMETEEEYELAAMHDFKVEWYKRQQETMRDWQAQVAEEVVRWQAKEDVLAKQRARKSREAKVLLKIQAMAAAKQHLANLVPNTIGGLNEVAFPDKRFAEISRHSMPEILDNAHQEVEKKVKATSLVDDLVSSRVASQVEAQQKGFKSHKERTKALRRQKLEQLQTKHGKIRITVDEPDLGGKFIVGPIQISSQDPVAEVQERVYEWLQQNEAALAKRWAFGVELHIDGVPITETMQLFNAPAGRTLLVPKPEPPPEEADDGMMGEGGEEEAPVGDEAE
eukprot:TRINITY_DN121777_c0_g1_i1.p1 TRINITY_DN121777_c0_g1~~TRINITY_DN121777_c0_g1_i1.p1  ORF type:complete len:455 (-),score=162.07 TRINITY_DN121777_c0_g1_i1:191-1555(-)